MDDHDSLAFFISWQEDWLAGMERNDTGGAPLNAGPADSPVGKGSEAGSKVTELLFCVIQARLNRARPRKSCG